MRIPGRKRSKIPKLWEKFSRERNEFLDRAKKNAVLTLPYLVEEASSQPGSQNGWQGVGAQAVNHLANKLAQILFPPQRSFFRVDLTQKGEAEILKAGYKKTDLAGLFSVVETQAMKALDGRQFRPAMVETFKHLLVAGTALLYKPKSGSIQCVPMHHFVNSRDTNGDLMDIILLQEKQLRTFEPSVRAAIEAANRGIKRKDEDDVKLYTHACYEGDGMWVVRQSVDDVPVGKESRVTSEKLPFIIVTWKRAYGESYGRPLCEDYSGDLFVIQFLSEAVARGAALMADIKYLIRPGSQTDIDHFVTSGTGEVITGVADDIHIVQLGKYADLTPVSAVLEEYRRRIGVVFMMESLVRRDAERVTAVEIQRDALELEQSLGGAYSLFATTLQGPLAMWALQETKSSFTKDKFDPVIITGIEALGRMAELDKLAQFSQFMTLPSTWPDYLQSEIKPDEYIKWVKGQISAEFPFFKTPEEKATEAQAQQQAQQEAMMTEGVAKSIPTLMKEQ
jgi:hypothetical protein